MANYLKQLFPYNQRSKFDASFKIVVLAEGYTTAEKPLFYKDVLEVWERLRQRYPFTISPYFGNSISLYGVFSPSNNHGYASTAGGAVGYNLFQTYFDSASQQLKLNSSLLDPYLEDCILDQGEVIEIKKHLFKNLYFIPKIGGLLIVVLLPSSGNLQAEAEIIDANRYYAIASSKDGLIEQVILRSIGRIIGLGDEFEMPGTAFDAPDANTGKLLNARFPNLYYNTGAAPNPTTDSNFKWQPAFSSLYNQPVPVHSHPGTINTLPTRPLSYKLELWEGGGGYRHEIYRSAFDCVMRRKIGDVTLPLKVKDVDFCSACKTMFEHLK